MDSETAKEKLVRRYKDIYMDKTGEDITDSEALDQALNLVSLVKAVYQPTSVLKK